jgi:hypothetical protein
LKKEVGRLNQTIDNYLSWRGAFGHGHDIRFRRGGAFSHQHSGGHRAQTENSFSF